MGVTDELLRNNEAYARSFDKGGLPMPPGKRVAVIACMDARIDVHRILGVEEGDVHVIRNAGGAVTEDAIRSLWISQALLGTREVILIHHADCGMRTFTDEAARARIEEATGLRPPFAFETFSSPEADVRQSIARLRASPFVPHRDQIRGFVYDDRTGRLQEVAEEAAA
jgi:carbonic anhydrase